MHFFISINSMWRGPALSESRNSPEVFSRESGVRMQPTAQQAAEKLDLELGLGGAALQRCDNWLVFSGGFSR
jgi:hypothetical protein